MFIIFITLIAASLAALATHLYTTLSFQAQTVEYTLIAFQQEQYLQGSLAYGLSLLARDNYLVQEVDVAGQATRMCDAMHTHIDYTKTKDGYAVTISLLQEQRVVSGLRAAIVLDDSSGKKLYSCVAIEPF